MKLMERIVLEKLWEHLLESELILNTHQHGFQSGRSCVTQLLECFHQWTDDLNMGKGTDTIYLDFSKAFDSKPLTSPIQTTPLRHKRQTTFMVEIVSYKSMSKSCPATTYVCMVACCVRCTTRNDIWTCAFPNFRERHSGILQHQCQTFRR